MSGSRFTQQVVDVDDEMTEFASRLRVVMLRLRSVKMKVSALSIVERNIGQAGLPS